MAGVMSRNKGKRAEREVIKIIQPVVEQVYKHVGMEPPRLQRNTLQSDVGGFDIVGLEWLALEVKHQQQFSLTPWWAQTVRQANGSQEPVLFYRKNNVPWRVRMYGYLSTDHNAHRSVVDISPEDFCAYLAMRLYEELNNGG